MVVEGRRLFRAGMLALAAFLLVGGAIGFVAAARQDAADAQTLAVPAPQPGDQATYSVQEVVLDRALVASQVVPDRVVYVWLPERWELDSSLGERLVHPLRATFSFSDRTLLRETVYDAASGAAVSESSVWSYERGGYWGSSSGTGGTSVAADGRFDDYHGPIGPCGFRASLQGRTYGGQDVLVQGRCDRSGRSDFSFVDNGWANTELGRVREFRDAQDPQLILQFDGSSPFPARATAALSEVYVSSALEGRSFVLERVAAAGGTGAYTPTSHSLFRRQSDDVASAPRTEWGFDETGLPAQRFPLSDAYHAALTQPTIPPVSGAAAGPDVAKWLQDHRSAYLASAMPYEGRDRTEQSIVSWFLAWTDGASLLGKQVTYAPAGVEFLYLPNATGQQAQVYDWDTHQAWNASGPGSAPWTPNWSASWPWQHDGLVQPQDVPQTLPRPADLMARYVTAGGDPQPNLYGFSIECADAACSKPAEILLVGRSVESWDNQYTSQYDVLVHPLYRVDDVMGIDGEGRLAYRWRYNSFENAAFPVLPGSPSGAGPAGGESGAGTPAWMLPSAPAAATGISLVALLAGALYYFWPALKSLAGVGLFSRVDDRAVLDLPTRRRLYDAILAEPGIHFMGLARKAGVGRGALDHHLRRLVAAGLVTMRKTPGYTCYFATGAFDRQVAGAAPLLRSEGSRAVFDAIRTEPGLSGRELARRLGRSASTVNYHLQRLQEAGLVFGEGAGMRLSPLGEQAAAAA